MSKTVDYEKLMHFLAENRNNCEQYAKRDADNKNYIDALLNNHESSIYDSLIESLSDVNDELGLGLVKEGE